MTPTALGDPAPDPRVADAAVALRPLLPAFPTIGVVLGSGLGAFTDVLEGRVDVPPGKTPHLLAPGVDGHAGGLSFGRIGRWNVLVLRGRVHLYEGHDVGDVVFGARLLVAAGCRGVLLTNAAGGIREGLAPGDLMLVSDHLNLTGRNPLVGARHGFVDLTRAYDAGLAEAARRAARETGIPLHEGVYAGLLGPSYETPAEIRMLRTLGADAVGMSTVLETIALRHAGARVGAVSCITNLAAGLSRTELSHADVKQTASAVKDGFSLLLSRWIELSGTVLATEA